VLEGGARHLAQISHGGGGIAAPHLAPSVCRASGVLPRGSGAKPQYQHASEASPERERSECSRGEADLAILAEGAISVPMYARQDPKELVDMMHDAGAKLVIVGTAELGEAVKAHWQNAPIVSYDTLFAGERVDAPTRSRAEDDVVTLIYTSGTSGVAKGVKLTVANVDSMLPVVVDALDRLMGRSTREREARASAAQPRGRGARAALGAAESGEARERGGEADARTTGNRRFPVTNDRVFHYLPFCFAGSRIVLWSCLFRGNPIRMSTDLNNLKEEFLAARPHYFLNVPALLERIKNGVEENLAKQGRAVRTLYDAAKEAYARQVSGRGEIKDGLVLAAARTVIFRKIRENIGKGLECLICGSAPLGEETQRWFEMLGIPVYQVYGLTETTAIVTMDEPRAAKPGRVGHAIAGCEMRLSDEGELLVQGPNVFAGYWNRDDATKEAFTEDGWFRTGDAAEVDPSGNWRIIGRTKNILVPSSGHNVAPEPIEQTLVEGIRGAEHAVVFGHGRPYLTAVISGAVTDAEVEHQIEKVNQELPHYRRIRKWLVTGETFTPENGLLTANQKLRRTALEKHFARELDELYR
jgi:long-chain acyl-CoA synthetase